MPTPVHHVKGIGPATAEKLMSAGITTAEELAAVTPEQLAKIPGFGPFRAGQVLEQARQLLAVEKMDDRKAVVSDPKTAAQSKTGKASTAKSKTKKKTNKKKNRRLKKKGGKKSEKKVKLQKDPRRSAKGKKSGSKKKKKQ